MIRVVGVLVVSLWAGSAAAEQPAHVFGVTKGMKIDELATIGWTEDGALKLASVPKPSGFYLQYTVQPTRFREVCRLTARLVDQEKASFVGHVMLKQITEVHGEPVRVIVNVYRWDTPHFSLILNAGQSSVNVLFKGVRECGPNPREDDNPFR
jgi:hypothetical protein